MKITLRRHKNGWSYKITSALQGTSMGVHEDGGRQPLTIKVNDDDGFFHEIAVFNPTKIVPEGEIP